MAFNQQESVLAVFVDFSGAYDCIWRAKLIEELKNMNIEGNMVTWISRFLDQRWTKVKYGETFSKYKQRKVGLPQGAGRQERESTLNCFPTTSQLEATEPVSMEKQPQ